MNILITGGAGYIGSVLTRRLLETHNVRVMDNLMYGGNQLVSIFERSDFDFVRGDVRRLEDCEFAVRNIDCVVHLAAIVGEPACRRNSDSWATNVWGTQNIYIKAKDEGVRTFIFASTCSNYGQDLLATEESELNPLGEYAEQKVAAEEWLKFQGDAVILRFATAYGFSPRMRLDLMVQQFVLEAMQTGKLELYNPDAFRPFVHVQDIAGLIEEVIWAYPSVTAGQVYNVGGLNITKRQLAEQIKDLLPSVKITTRETGDKRNYSVSFAKIRKAFGLDLHYTPWGFIEQMVKAQQAGMFSETIYSNVTY